MSPSNGYLAKTTVSLHKAFVNSAFSSSVPWFFFCHFLRTINSFNVLSSLFSIVHWHFVCFQFFLEPYDIPMKNILLNESTSQKARANLVSFFSFSDPVNSKKWDYIAFGWWETFPPPPMPHLLPSCSHQIFIICTRFVAASIKKKKKERNEGRGGRISLPGRGFAKQKNIPVAWK